MPAESPMQSAARQRRASQTRKSGGVAGAAEEAAGAKELRVRRDCRHKRSRKRGKKPERPEPPPRLLWRRPIEGQCPNKPSAQPGPALLSDPGRAHRTAAQLLGERTAHGRAGDPALASRMAHLESMLRRLLASPLHRLDEAEEAPAGPGVFLLSDSDQVTSYYMEACQTLRIGCGNLVRGGPPGRTPRRARRLREGLKAKLAEYLGINEAKVSQYMKDHCVVRWIQLDDDAPLLAHFAIGVLRTPLNLD